MSNNSTLPPLPEYEFIHQISMKYYQNWEEMKKKIKFYIDRFFENKTPYLDMSDEVYKKFKVNEILSGDIVNVWEGSCVFRIDFRDYNDPKRMFNDLIFSLKGFFKNPELQSRNLVVQLVHYILPF